MIDFHFLNLGMATKRQILSKLRAKVARKMKKAAKIAERKKMDAEIKSLRKKLRGK